jgi:hypothetical protein
MALGEKVAADYVYGASVTARQAAPEPKSVLTPDG